jgi:hypothetical protein
MIDVENKVFDTVSKALRAAHGNALFVTGEYVQAPPKFPAVSLIESDNRVATRYRTLNVENAASVMYELNVYSNKTAGKKSEAKAIANTADEIMASLGFTRTMRNTVPNFNDASIYRIVCRYEGVVIPNDDEIYYIHTR